MRWPLIAMASVLVSAHAGGAARAGTLDFYGTANGSVATTDNANGAEYNSDPNKPSIQKRKGDVFSDVRPGFIVTYYAPRMIQEITSEVDFLYHIFTARPTVTFRAGWKAFFIPGPRSEMSVNADASQGQLNALSASVAPDAADPTQILPPGRVDIQSATGGQNLSWAATEQSRLFQRSFGRFGTTHDELAGAMDINTLSWEVGAAAGFDHTLKHDNFVFEVGGSYVYMKKDDPGNRQMGSRLDRQWNPRAVIVWQHDINKFWSTNVDAGGVYVLPIETLHDGVPQARHNDLFPVAGVTTAYTDVWGRAQLSVRRQVTPNLFIAQNTVADSATATFAMPLTLFDKDAQKRAPKVVGIGNVAVERTQLIDPSSNATNSVYHVARVDLGIGWSPRPGQTFGLRYELTYQNGTTSDADMQVPEFFRNTFYFTFALRYPEDILVKVPRRGASVRADKKDLAPIGAEPVIVDPQEFLEGGDGK